MNKGRTFLDTLLDMRGKTIQEDLRPLEKDLERAISYAEETGNIVMGDPQERRNERLSPIIPAQSGCLLSDHC